MYNYVSTKATLNQLGLLMLAISKIKNGTCKSVLHLKVITNAKLIPTHSNFIHLYCYFVLSCIITKSKPLASLAPHCSQVMISHLPSTEEYLTDFDYSSSSTSVLESNNIHC